MVHTPACHIPFEASQGGLPCYLRMIGLEPDDEEIMDSYIYAVSGSLCAIECLSG